MRDLEKQRESNRKSAAKRWANPVTRERWQAQRKRYALELRMQVFEAYGGAWCACCNERDLVFLTLDHVNGGGNDHRRTVGSGKLYRWLRQQGFPVGYQVLCWNCNAAKHILGECPHATGKPRRRTSTRNRPRTN